VKLFFDGGCRPNPGAMEAAVVARGEVFQPDSLGHGSSHEAEWRALLHALHVAASLGARDVTLLGDSAAVIEQAAGRAKCRTASAREARAAFERACLDFHRVRVRRVARTQNLAGIALARVREETL
jgi:ribonuclease HI